MTTTNAVIKKNVADIIKISRDIGHLMEEVRDHVYNRKVPFYLYNKGQERVHKLFYQAGWISRESLL